MFFKINANEENLKDYSGTSSYINETGIYEIIIKSLIVNDSPNGGQALDLWFEYNGKEQPIFRAIPMKNNDGSENSGQDLLRKLAIICGAATDGEISDPVSRKVPIGAKGELKECMVLTDFDDTPIFIRVQMEYGIYQDEIQERKLIRQFFRYEDKATASEIVNNVDKGNQYAKEESYPFKVSYKDGLSEEDVTKWKAERRSGAKKEETKKPSSGFGGKKFGNK